MIKADDKGKDACNFIETCVKEKDDTFIYNNDMEKWRDLCYAELSLPEPPTPTGNDRCSLNEFGKKNEGPGVTCTCPDKDNAAMEIDGKCRQCHAGVIMRDKQQCLCW